MMKYTIVFLTSLSFLFACSGKKMEDAEVIATVGERTLRRSDVTSIIPRNVNTSDSLLYAESYIKRWIKNALVYDVATNNIDNNERAEIDRLVDEYRNSLIRHRYQDRLIRERLSADIRESDRLNYYEENQNKFLLDKSLIKGLFLKVPADAPGLADVKTWYKQSTTDALEKIEKYSLQNAVIYEYFYDRWVELDEIMDIVPMTIPDPKTFLQANKSIEVADSSYCYLLNINEYIAAGMVAPYDYSVPQINEMLINQHKVEYVKKFEEDLYNDAIRNGKAKLYTK